MTSQQEADKLLAEFQQNRPLFLAIGLLTDGERDMTMLERLHWKRRVATFLETYRKNRT